MPVGQTTATVSCESGTPLSRRPRKSCTSGLERGMVFGEGLIYVQGKVSGEAVLKEGVVRGLKKGGGLSSGWSSYRVSTSVMVLRNLSFHSSLKIKKRLS